MLPDALRPIRAQIHVPVGPDGRLVDSGRWRELGITHWHLVRRDWNRSDPERFDTARYRADAHRPSHGIVHDPHEVAEWLISTALRAVDGRVDMLAHSGLDTAAGIAEQRMIRFWAAMVGRDVAKSIGLSSTRIADLTAYAMTAADCAGH